MKAEKGDLIRIIPCDSNGYIGELYEIGDILEVKERDDDAGVIAIIPDDSDGVYVYDYEYVIHRKVGAEDSQQDAVNHPNHYTQGKFETIEVIEEITKGYDDGFIAYCIGNTLKYIARAPFKHGTPAEDLAKAKRYIEFAIEHLDAKSTQD